MDVHQNRCASRWHRDCCRSGWRRASGARRRPGRRPPGPGAGERDVLVEDGITRRRPAEGSSAGRV